MVCIINKSRLCIDCQYIFLIPYLCQLGMNTSSFSSHLCDCKGSAESVSVAKRKWRDFDPLNSVPYHLKMLIQISICHNFQYEKFVSLLSTAVLLYQGYRETAWQWSAVILHCSCVLQRFVLPWPCLEFQLEFQLSLCFLALVHPCHFSGHWHVKYCTVGSTGCPWVLKGSIVDDSSPV